MQVLQEIRNYGELYRPPEQLYSNYYPNYLYNPYYPLIMSPKTQFIIQYKNLWQKRILRSENSWPQLESENALCHVNHPCHINKPRIDTDTVKGVAQDYLHAQQGAVSWHALLTFRGLQSYQKHLLHKNTKKGKIMNTYNKGNR